MPVETNTLVLPKDVSQEVWQEALRWLTGAALIYRDRDSNFVIRFTYKVYCNEEWLKSYDIKTSLGN